MMCTRPDICWIITKLSQHLSKPLQSHWVAVKHVFRYLKATIDRELVYTKSDDELMLIGYMLTGHLLLMTDEVPQVIALV